MTWTGNPAAQNKFETTVRRLLAMPPETQKSLQRRKQLMIRYTKLDASGAALPADATGHNAVQVDHPLLARPLIVTAHRAPKEMTWKQATKWAEGLDINGWSWRLPTVEEALFIPDRSKYPALDVTFFPDFTGYEWIWTSTPDAESPSGCAWIVYLDYGFSVRYYRSNHYHVRAVRAGQF